MCSGLAICPRAFVMAGFQRGVRNPQIQIDLWFARFTGLIWALLCIALGSFLCILMCSVLFSVRTSWSDPWNIRVHADVTEVSQEYVFDARKLRDRPRKLLSATELVVSTKRPGDLLRAFLELQFSPSQVLSRRSAD